MPEDAMQSLREKYPEYNSIPDEKLARMIVKKYPVYRQSFSRYLGAANAPANTGAVGGNARSVSSQLIGASAKGVQSEQTGITIPRQAKRPSTPPKTQKGVPKFPGSSESSDNQGSLQEQATAIIKRNQAANRAARSQYRPVGKILGGIPNPLEQVSQGAEFALQPLGHLLSRGLRGAKEGIEKYEGVSAVSPLQKEVESQQGKLPFGEAQDAEPPGSFIGGIDPDINRAIDAPSKSYPKAFAKAAARGVRDLLSLDNVAIGALLGPAAGAGKIAKAVRMAASGFFGAPIAQDIGHKWDQFKKSGYKDKDALADIAKGTVFLGALGAHGVYEGTGRSLFDHANAIGKIAGDQAQKVAADSVDAEYQKQTAPVETRPERMLEAPPKKGRSRATKPVQPPQEPPPTETAPAAKTAKKPSASQGKKTSATPAKVEPKAEETPASSDAIESAFKSSKGEAFEAVGSLVKSGHLPAEVSDGLSKRVIDRQIDLMDSKDMDPDKAWEQANREEIDRIKKEHGGTPVVTPKATPDSKATTTKETPTPAVATKPAETPAAKKQSVPAKTKAVVKTEPESLIGEIDRDKVPEKNVYLYGHDHLYVTDEQKAQIDRVNRESNERMKKLAPTDTRKRLSESQRYTMELEGILRGAVPLDKHLESLSKPEAKKPAARSTTSVTLPPAKSLEPTRNGYLRPNAAPVQAQTPEGMELSYHPDASKEGYVARYKGQESHVYHNLTERKWHRERLKGEGTIAQKKGHSTLADALADFKAVADKRSLAKPAAVKAAPTKKSSSFSFDEEPEAAPAPVAPAKKTPVKRSNLKALSNAEPVEPAPGTDNLPPPRATKINVAQAQILGLALDADDPLSAKLDLANKAVNLTAEEVGRLREVIRDKKLDPSLFGVDLNPGKAPPKLPGGALAGRRDAPAPSAEEELTPRQIRMARQSKEQETALRKKWDDWDAVERTNRDKEEERAKPLEEAYAKALEERQKRKTDKDTAITEKGDIPLHSGVPGGALARALLGDERVDAFKEKAANAAKILPMIINPAGMDRFSEKMARMGREHIAQYHREMAQTRSMLKKAEEKFPDPDYTPIKRMTEAERHAFVADIEARKLPADKKLRAIAENLMFIDRMEKGEAQANPVLDSYAKLIRSGIPGNPVIGVKDVMGFDQYAKAIEAHVKKFDSPISDYFPHIWKDTGSKEAILAGMARRPLAGKEGYLRKRSIDTTLEGIKRGLEPVSLNPATISAVKMAEISKSLMAHKWMNEARKTVIRKGKRATKGSPAVKTLNLVTYFRKGQQPEGWKAIDDKIAKVIHPGELVGDGPPGTGRKVPVEEGQFYAPEYAADIVNNYLSPGLRGQPGPAGSVYRGLAAMTNTMNMVHFGFSGFHAITTSVNAVSGELGLAIKNAAEGNIVRAGRGLVRTAPAVGLNFIDGQKMIEEYLRPGSHHGSDIPMLVNALIEGGGRAGLPAEYRINALEKLQHSFKKRDVAGGVMALPFAAVEGSTALIMRGLVPRVKLGAFAEMARYELGKLPVGHGEDESRKAMANAWDSVEDRFGQMTYDNLFWNRIFLDTAHLLVQSPGWSGGTARTLAGSIADTALMPHRAVEGVKRIAADTRATPGNAGDKAKAAAASFKKGQVFTHRQSFMLGSVLAGMALGGMYYYLANKKRPQTLEDYLHPVGFNGKRVNLATYMKDYQGFTGGYKGNATEFLKTVYGKLGPLVKTPIDIALDKDYRGKEIANPDDPSEKQLTDYLKFLAFQMLPISMNKLKSGKTPTMEESLGATPYTPVHGEQWWRNDSRSRRKASKVPSIRGY